MDLLIVFLGNPGNKYVKTRHNLPWLVSDNLSDNWSSKFNGKIARYPDPVATTLLLKPETYMNNSGKSVIQVLNFYKMKPEDLIVVHDDSELDFGVIDLKDGGGNGGHRGLQSICRHLKHGNFKRLRLGVGRPVKGTLSAYVLSRFSQDEEMFIDDYVLHITEIIDKLCNVGFVTLAAGYHKKKVV